MRFLLALAIFSLLSSCGKEPSTTGALSQSSDELNENAPHKSSPSPNNHTKKVRLPDNEFVESFFNSYKDKADVYSAGNVIVDDIVINFVDQMPQNPEGEARGVCIKEDNKTPVIKLYRHDWDSRYQRTYYQRQASLFHLLGHCILDRAHFDDTLHTNFDGINFEMPKSFMHSDFRRGRFPAAYQDYDNPKVEYWGWIRDNHDVPSDTPHPSL